MKLTVSDGGFRLAPHAPTLESHHFPGGIAVNVKSSLIAALLAGLLLSSSPIFAHHSPAEFDGTKTVSVKGTVTQFAWNNPHAYIYIDAENDKGEVEKWAAELGTLGVLSRINWRRDSVKPGDQITIYGNPARDGRSLMRLMKVVLPNGQELLAGRAQP
jgi:Family of unknown function (DUF6152)